MCHHSTLILHSNPPLYHSSKFLIVVCAVLLNFWVPLDVWAHNHNIDNDVKAKVHPPPQTLAGLQSNHWGAFFIQWPCLLIGCLSLLIVECLSCLWVLFFIGMNWPPQHLPCPLPSSPCITSILTTKEAAGLHHIPQLLFLAHIHDNHISSKIRPCAGSSRNGGSDGNDPNETGNGVMQYLVQEFGSIRKNPSLKKVTQCPESATKPL